ncbi:MAG: hypothetical protein AABW59_04310 [archaeon]
MQRSVDILPWAHSGESALHRSLIDYVKKLPRGAEVFLEVSQDSLKFFDAVEDFVAGKEVKASKLMDQLKASSERIDAVSVGERHKLIAKSPQTIAYVELINEARRRNLRLIPIETPVSRANAVRALKNVDEFIYDGHGIFAGSELVRSNEFREKSFARQIRSLMNRNKKYFAIVGLNHMDSVNRELRALKVVSRTNVNFIPKNLRAYVAQSRLMQRTARKEFRKGNDVAVGKAYFGDQFKKVPYPRLIDSAEMARILSEKLVAQRINSEKRQKARVMQKNTRRVVK